jgi:hypothetical protein
MADPTDKKDLDAERNWMMERRPAYGREFSVSVPVQQPAPRCGNP